MNTTKIFVALLIVFSLSTVVFANEGKEVIILNASMGNITFHHWQHQDRLKDCTLCHASKVGGNIPGFGKDFAHKTCKGCHLATGKGPTTCKVCHQK